MRAQLRVFVVDVENLADKPVTFVRVLEVLDSGAALAADGAGIDRGLFLLAPIARRRDGHFRARSHQRERHGAAETAPAAGNHHDFAPDCRIGHRYPPSPFGPRRRLSRLSGARYGARSWAGNTRSQSTNT